MKKAIFLLIFICLAKVISAQKHDNIWLLGLGGGSQSPLNDEWGVSILDFSESDRPQVIEKQEYAVNFIATDASICDSSGQLLFYTNGEKVYGPNHQLMENGNAIAITNSDGYGYRLGQGAVALPYPGHPQQYMLVTVEDYFYEAMGWKLFYHVIDMSANNGLGKVIEKRHLLVQDSMAWGKITAVKHANGRDWWFVIPRDFSNKYYVGLLDPSGVTLSTQAVGQVVWDGLGQAVFSPDGQKYIRVDDRTTTDPTLISIMDFDRCTGQFSNFQTTMLNTSTYTFGAGVAVSPDSRYLYVTNTTVAYQYDLWADDVFSTQTVIAEYDDFTSYLDRPTYFLSCQAAPDGRIYIQTLHSGFFLHYINAPNKAGNSCGFIQHGLELPTLTAREIPNFPNYHLGPLDGSACDTLGLDNHPLANWRWEQEDTLSPLQVTFTDLTAYEPATWHWDFGDGQTSQDTSPVHTYAGPGEYHVCLIVSNAYSSDTLCRVLYLGVSGSEEVEGSGVVFQVYPNPADEAIWLRSDASLPQGAVLALFNLTGQEVARMNLSGGNNPTRLSVSALPAGVYFYKIQVWGAALQTGKLLIAH